jgi:soluble lytic murein transglycosylase
MLLTQDNLKLMCQNVGNLIGIEARILYAISMTESSGNTQAVSKSNAVGLMQMTEIALKQIQKSFGKYFTLEDMKDAEKALEVGGLYFKWLLSIYELDLAVLSYAWGIGNVKNWLSNTKYDNQFIDEAIPKEKKDYLYNFLFWYKNF